ncbi:MAG: DUF882 domain-containing protein [Elusimicrobia bacterium]|nr:DUF882 domain-containing protein [Elusimicrobiota bacterium]
MPPLPGFPAAAADAAAPDNGLEQPVSTATANGDPVVTEQDILDLEEGTEAGQEVSISSAPPEPPAPVNLGGNGKLTLTRHDTGEKVSVNYRNKKGEYDKAELAKINYIMRCSLDGSRTEISVKLVELLDAVEDKFGKKGLVLLSGYRTLELNRTIKGAAEHSMHMLGWAADIRAPGYSSTKVTKFGRKLWVGGVGYYPNKGFTHLDVGKARYWVVRRAPRKHRAVRLKATARSSAKVQKNVKTSKPAPKKRAAKTTSK